MLIYIYLCKRKVRTSTKMSVNFESCLDLTANAAGSLFAELTSWKVFFLLFHIKPELMDHPVRVMIPKLLYTRHIYSILSNNICFKEWKFLSVHYLLLPPCFALYFVFTPYVMGFGTGWAAAGMVVSKLQSCVTLLIAETTQDRTHTFIVLRNDLL